MDFGGQVNVKPFNSYKTITKQIRIRRVWRVRRWSEKSSAAPTAQRPPVSVLRSGSQCIICFRFCLVLSVQGVHHIQRLLQRHCWLGRFAGRWYEVGWNWRRISQHHLPRSQETTQRPHQGNYLWSKSLSPNLWLNDQKFRSEKGLSPQIKNWIDWVLLPLTKQIMTSDDAEASLSSSAVLNPEASKPSTCPGQGGDTGKRRRRKRQTEPCPSPWVASNGGYCFLVHENTMTKGEAESYCSMQDSDGRLMRFYDVPEFTRLYNILYTSE